MPARHPSNTKIAETLNGPELLRVARRCPAVGLSYTQQVPDPVPAGRSQHRQVVINKHCSPCHIVHTRTQQLPEADVLLGPAETVGVESESSYYLIRKGGSHSDRVSVISLKELHLENRPGGDST